jgi:hypothetical protein
VASLFSDFIINGVLINAQAPFPSPIAPFLWNNLMLHLQCIRKVFRPLHLFHILLRHSLIIFASSIYTRYPIMTKQKQVLRNVCNINRKYLIYITIQSLCYENWNWAQVYSVSIDLPWDVSTTWLESTCGKFNWLDMIWKGAHLSQ